jgi:hypothetical protein
MENNERQSMNRPSIQTIGRPRQAKTKSLIQASLIVGTLVALLSSGGTVVGNPVAPSNPFVTLLEGIYEPVTVVPDLGLSVDISQNNDSVAKIAIFNVDSGVPNPTDQGAGTFYVQFASNSDGTELCAYQFPKGSILANFTMVDDVIIDFTTFPDGSWIENATEELDILEATGIYQSFTGGHIHMVDRLEYRAADNKFIEHCFCHYSRAHGKP